MPTPSSPSNADRGSDTPEIAPLAVEHLTVGDTLVERYRIERVAGPTEAGILYEATDLARDRRVAMELASSLCEPRARRKWTRDAMLAQRLQGEHVLRVLDVGMLPDGVPFVVRELALCTLADELRTRGALAISHAVAWTLEACEAVAEAHAIGMAHGDLRLDNIYLAMGASGPTVKVAWTSAAKAERAAREDVARDIAGLGAMVRVLARGRLDHAPDAATTLPGDVAHAVARALAERPDETFRNVAELARVLAPFAPPGHGSARTVALLLSRAGIVGAAIPSPETPEIVPEIVPRSSRRPSVQSSEPEAQAHDRVSFTDEWFGKASRRSLTGDLSASPRKRGLTFALVSFLLLAAALGGSWFLLASGQLPRWTGTAPEPVGTTEVTAGALEPTGQGDESARQAAAEKARLDALVPRPVESLPDAPPVEPTTPPVAPPVEPPVAPPVARRVAPPPPPLAATAGASTPSEPPVIVPAETVPAMPAVAPESPESPDEATPAPAPAPEPTHPDPGPGY